MRSTYIASAREKVPGFNEIYMCDLPLDNTSIHWQQWWRVNRAHVKINIHQKLKYRSLFQTAEHVSIPRSVWLCA